MVERHITLDGICAAEASSLPNRLTADAVVESRTTLDGICAAEVSSIPSHLTGDAVVQRRITPGGTSVAMEEFAKAIANL